MFAGCLHMLTYLCTEACHAVGTWAGLCETLRQQPGGQAVVGGGQRSVVLQQVPRAAALPVMQAERRGGTKVSDMRWTLGLLRGWKNCCILHFELLAVALGQNTCVGEREPAAPADNKGYCFCGRRSFRQVGPEEPYILFFSFSP